LSGRELVSQREGEGATAAGGRRRRYLTSAALVSEASMARACGQRGALFMFAVGPADSEGHQLGVPPLAR
jgi:hypothetical protein